MLNKKDKAPETIQTHVAHDQMSRKMNWFTLLLLTFLDLICRHFYRKNVWLEI